MQKEIIRQILRKLDAHRGECCAALHKESYIIASQEGKLPRLEKCRIFTFLGDDKQELGNIVVMNWLDADEIRAYIKNDMKLSRYPRGAEDPSWLVEVWTR